MNKPRPPLIRQFRRTDQDEAREALAAGFRERFGKTYDDNADHDLDDLAAMFSEGLLLVALVGGRIVGTGGLVVTGEGTAEVRRMSTKRAYRRRGIASAVLRKLLAEARARGCRRVVLGTEAAWDDAVAFYRAQGFQETARRGDSIWFELVL